MTVTSSGPVSRLAAQDGSGSWKALTGTSFAVSDSAGRYGVAWVCTPSSGQPQVGTVQATTADGTSLTSYCGTSTVGIVPPSTVSGQQTGIPASGTVCASLGNGIVQTFTG